MNRQTEEKFREAMSLASSLLWEINGRHYVHSGSIVSSDFSILSNLGGYSEMYRDNGDGSKKVYADWNSVPFGERELKVRVHNPDAEYFITKCVGREGLIKYPLPPGTTLESLDFDADALEDFDHGWEEKVTIVRSYDDALWNAFMAEERRKQLLAIRRGSSRLG